MTRRAFFGTLIASYAAARWPWTPPRNLGISIRFIRQFDVTTDAVVSRIDVLYGWATLRPSLGCRIVEEDPLAWLKTRLALRRRR